MNRYLLLGTAGHIDHGKTALVRALTGVETDRLPAEKARNITIDLGFAPLELEELCIGVVDVPGHERFVKNMLAGASGIDLAMLVVAVDDSVKPQTCEHLDILQHMKLRTGVVALTKCDLAETDWINLVEEEVTQLTTGTFLENAEVVRVSTRTGTGLDGLRSALTRAGRIAIRDRGHRAGLPFRMTIDRAFTIAGQGTVVTGSIGRGTVRVGDTVELQPQGESVRVRALHNHGMEAEELQVGQRAAINLAGIRYDQVARGQCLCPPGALRPSQLITVRFKLSDSVSRALKHGSQVRMNIGAAEVFARLKLLGGAKTAPGEQSLAQLALAEAVAVDWGQPFVLRAMSPVETLGGGVVLEGVAKRRKRIDQADEQALNDLASEDPARRVAAAYYLHRAELLPHSRLCAATGVADAEDVVERLLAEGTLCEVTDESGAKHVLHERVLGSLCKRLEKELAAAHEKKPLKLRVERSRLAARFMELDDAMFDAVLTHLSNEVVIDISSSGIALVGRRPQLTDAQKQVLQQVKPMLYDGGLRPPTVDELCSQIGQHKAAVRPLLELATDQQWLIRITDNIYLTRDAVDAAKSQLLELANEGGELTVSLLRQQWNTSRKVAVPLCEYFDAIGVTLRRGDARQVASPANTSD